MSETASTIIKLISAFTSTRTSTKFVIVSVFIVLSWKYLSDPINSLGVPENSVSLVILLSSLGLGSIIGQMLFAVLDMVWVKAKPIMGARQKKLEDRRQDKLRQESHQHLKQDHARKFDYFFPHLNSIQKEMMRRITRKDQTIDVVMTDSQVLLEEDFIQSISNITSNSTLVTLNPLIKEHVVEYFQTENKEKVKVFYENITSEEETVLGLLEDSNVDQGEVELQLLKDGTNNNDVLFLTTDMEDTNGIWLYIDEECVGILSELNSNEYKEDIWIEAGRIPDWEP